MEFIKDELICVESDDETKKKRYRHLINRKHPTIHKTRLSTFP